MGEGQSKEGDGQTSPPEFQRTLKSSSAAPVQMPVSSSVLGGSQSNVNFSSHRKKTHRGSAITFEHEKHPDKKDDKTNEKLKKESSESKKQKKKLDKLEKKKKKKSEIFQVSQEQIQRQGPRGPIHRQISRNTLAGFSERRIKILSNEESRSLTQSSGHEHLLESIRNDEEIIPRNRHSCVAPPKPEAIPHPTEEIAPEVINVNTKPSSAGAYNNHCTVAEDSSDDDFGTWNDDDDDDDDDDDSNIPVGGYVSHPVKKQPVGGYLKEKKVKQVASGGYGIQESLDTDSDDDDESDSNSVSDDDHFTAKDFDEVFRYLSTLNNDDLIKVGKEIDNKMKGKFVPALINALNDHRDEKRALGEDSGDEDEYHDEHAVAPSPTTIHCDWNKNFQQYLEDLKLSGHIQEARMNSFIGLSNLALDFIHAAKIYGRIIISEAETPVEYKTIQPMKIGGIAGGDKYIVNNILFKFAVDNHSLFDNEEAAMKIAGHDLKGLIGYFNLGIEDLHFPLMALVDYLGYRLIAMSFLPINKKTIVYGSSDGGITMHNSNPILTEKMKLSAKLLNLKPHKAGRTEGNEIMIQSAADLEGHEVDGHFYLLDFSRAFPPTAYNSKTRNGNLYQLFRVEFLTKYNRPLCPDTYSGFTALQNPQHDIEEINQAHNYLLNVVVYKCAIQLESRTIDKNSPINLKGVLHELGINLRYMGFIRCRIQKNEEMRTAILIEMVARVIKHQLRAVLRQKLKQTKAFLDHSCREAVVERLNLIFGNSEESEEYFDSHIKVHLLRNYDKALTADEEAQPLKSLLRAHLTQLFESVLKISSLQFSRNSTIEFSTFENAFQVRKPIHLSDLERIGVQVRHMNIVALALGYVLKNQARELKSEGSSHSRRLCKLAIDHFKIALSDNPGDKRVLRELADTTLLLGDDENAEKYYLKAYNADKKDVNTMFKYAVFLEERERYKEAEDFYLRTLEIDPNLDHCLQRYGHFLETQGHVEEAEEFFIRASKVRSKNASHSISSSQTPRQMDWF